MSFCASFGVPFDFFLEAGQICVLRERSLSIASFWRFAGPVLGFVDDSTADQFGIFFVIVVSGAGR